MRASVVVPTYNRRQLLTKCLNGLLDQTITQDDYEIIVVDDCSTDDTQRYMEEMIRQVKNLIYVRHEANKGRVAARNEGIWLAKSDIVIFLDNDNIPSRYFIETHLRYHKFYGDEHIAVVGNAYFSFETIKGSNFGRFLQSRYLGCRTQKELKKLNLTNLPPNYLGGLNHSIRKEDLVAVGLYDTSFRYYGGEDEYMGYSLKKLGVRIVFSEEAKSIHYDNISISRYKIKYMEAGREGLPIMIKKNPDYKKTTKIGWLMPIEMGRDSLINIFRKVAIQCILNRVTLKLIETFAIATDNWPWAYYQYVYRLLTAGWFLQGFRSKERGRGIVNY